MDGTEFEVEEFEEQSLPDNSSEEYIKRELQRYMDSSIGRDDDEIVYDREDNLKRFYSQPLGNETEGRSQFVSSECRDAVMWALPSLLNVFLTADKIAEFTPSCEAAIKQAEQQTDLINYLVTQENDAFKVFYTWFFDALVTKNGFVKYYYDEEVSVKDEMYSGISDMAFAKLVADENVEVVSSEEVTNDMVQELPNGTYAPVPVKTFNVQVRRRSVEKKYKIENIAPEDILIDKKATCIEDARFVGIRYEKTKSDLIEAGFPEAVVDTLSKGDGRYLNSESDVRDDVNMITDVIDDTDDYYYPIMECYAYIDENNDGIDELHRIVVNGIESNMEILQDDVVDEIPVASLTPFIKPYSMFGMSMVENVKDLQNVNTVLWRNMLDYLYSTAQPMWELLDRAVVNKDDLQTRIPGGYIRTRQIGSVVPVNNPPMQPEFFGFFDRLNAMRDMRTGVTPLNSGLDKDALKANNATSGLEMMSAGRQLLDCIARCFAETGIKRLFRGILGLVTKYQDVPTTIRLRGGFVSIDPTTWEHPVNLSVNVGLGTGTAKTRAADMQQVMALQLQLMPLGVASPQNIFNSAMKVMEILGYKDGTSFFTDPSTIPPQPHKPSMEELQEQKNKMDFQAKQLEAEMDKYKVDRQADVELTKLSVDTALKREALQLKAKEGKVSERTDYFPGVPDK